jgi:AcrR family transcriptional regulator
MPHVKGAARRRAGNDTRQRLILAATELLASGGFARTTTRAIGGSAGCNPALVAYHFGSLNQLLLAALDASSQQRLAQYRSELAAVESRRQLRSTVRRLYREDRESGHVTVLAEMVAGGLMDRELGREVASRVAPWVELAEAALRQVLPAAALRRRVPISHLAYALVALFLGLEILGQLAGDHERDAAVVEQLTASGGLWTTGANHAAQDSATADVDYRNPRTRRG